MIRVFLFQCVDGKNGCRNSCLTERIVVEIQNERPLVCETVYPVDLSTYFNVFRSEYVGGGGSNYNAVQLFVEYVSCGWFNQLTVISNI